MTKPATPQISDEALDALKRAAGPKGVIEGDDRAPFFEEPRSRWVAKTPLVLAPASTGDISKIVTICAERRISITPQGGNTGLVGGQIPTNGEILISLKRLRKIRDVSPLNNAMTVEAGVTLAEAQEIAAKADRLFPLSIGAEGTCQIGGVISTNAGGVNVLHYGNMRNLVLGIEAVLPSGEIWNGLKTLRKDNTGYDLKQLFIGGEGTLGIVTAAVLKLFPRPAEKITALAGLSSVDNAVELLSRAQAASGGQVTSFELFSREIFDLVLKNIPDTRDPLGAPHAWYTLMEFSSAQEGALRAPVETLLADALEAGDIADATIAENDAQARALWHMRHAMSEAMKPEGASAKHDVSVPVASIPAFLKDADAAIVAICPGARIAAFGHVGDGNIHYDIMQPTNMTPAQFASDQQRIEQAVYDLIGKYHGSISAEHGIGLARRDELARRKSEPELAMMRAIKTALDPLGIMNPGKML